MNQKAKCEPPWDFLLSASRTTLQSFEASRLNHAANVRKEIVQLLDAWLDENSNALLARWLIEYQERIACGGVSACGSNLPAKPTRGASDNMFAEQPIPVPRIHRAS